MHDFGVLTLILQLINIILCLLQMVVFLKRWNPR